MKNPNAVAGTAGGGAGVLVIFVLGLVHVTIDPTVAAAIATVAAGGILFIGHEGIIGAWQKLLHGTDKAPKK